VLEDKTHHRIAVALQHVVCEVEEWHLLFGLYSRELRASANVCVCVCVCGSAMRCVRCTHCVEGNLISHQEHAHDTSDSEVWGLHTQ
jgi:hypothetical protein